VQLLNGFPVTHRDISSNLKHGALRLVAYLALVQRGERRQNLAEEICCDSAHLAVRECSVTN
jgi:hypothetical protein